jgi:hypothetical protein
MRRDALDQFVFHHVNRSALTTALRVIFLVSGAVAFWPGINAAWAEAWKNAVSIDAGYPGGNICVDRTEENRIYVSPDLRDTEGWWFYWNFRAAGAAGRRVTFCFLDRDPIGVRGPAISVDGGMSWSWMGSKTVRPGQYTYTFSPNADDVRFAFTIPYQEMDLQRFLAKHQNSPDLVVESLCKSAKGRSVELVRAGRLDGDPRFRILITARHHACETMANYVLEGMLDTVLADNDDGYWFQRNVEVMAIPFMDKDGVEDGDQGKNRRPHDHNRDYIGPSIYPETAALRTLTRNWSNGKLRAAFDLHCPYLRGKHNEDIYIVGSRDQVMWEEQQTFGALLEQANKNGALPYLASDNLPYGESWNKSSNFSAGRSFARWAEGLEGLRLSASFEIPYANAGGQTVTPDTARSFGRSVAKAIRQYLESLEKPAPANVPPVQVAGVFPAMTVMAKGLGSDSEAGIGALIPWGDRLWAVGYVAHIRGQGLGLYEIREDMTMRRHPASVTGTYANRMVHWPSGQAFIGPYAIDADGQVRVIEALKDKRLAATCAHLTDPKKKVYFLGMEGGFWEVDVRSLDTTQIFDLRDELRIVDAKEHFKSAYAGQGRVVVANNTYDEKEFLGERHAGRLAEWDGAGWTIIEENPFVEVGGSEGNPTYGGNTLYAIGWTRSSAVLRALVNGQWQRYLLPKSSQTWDHAWNTEWMRIRHAMTERLLMDAHGTFFELPPFAYGGRICGIRPICTHLRVVPDFCHWRGLFVMASDQIDHDEGQPQSGLWFGNIDDLWTMGKPAGWGGPWQETLVKAGEVSDPFLMTGYDAKVLHLTCKAKQPVRFEVEVDFLGDGHWMPCESFDLTRKKPYVHHEFPHAFSGHWVRIKVNKDCTATACFIYN